MKPDSEPSLQPWQTPEVAHAQRALIERQLTATANGRPPAPFMAFLHVFRELIRAHPTLAKGRLLDIGCGVGHYGVLCERYWPFIEYTGTDISEHMLTHARALVRQGVFHQCAFPYNAFGEFDMVLVSQTLEYTEDPFAALEHALQNMRGGAFLLLHRLRVTLNISERLYEDTYCGYKSVNYLWNRPALEQLCARYGILEQTHLWNDSNLTLVLRLVTV